MVTVKEYLQQSFEIEKSIKAKKDQLQKLKDIREDLGSKLSLDKVQTSPNPDRLNKISDSIMDLENLYQEDICKLYGFKQKIKKAIGIVQNVTYQHILEERYVNLKEWCDIASDNGYGERRVYDFHGEALQDMTSQILQQYFNAL